MMRKNIPNSDEHSHFYQRLKDCRTDRDLTQEAIAMRLGIDQRVYSTYETGKAQIPTRHLITLAVFYGVSIDYLVGLTDEPTPPVRRGR